jgi:heat shock protein HtpX
MRRWMLFFGVNLLIILTISTITSAFGLNHYITAYGIDYKALLVFCLMWGMGGSIISLMISKWIAKKMMGVQIVEQNSQYGYLINMVSNLSKRSGITKMPEVGIYNSPDVNAFATGPSKNNSLVAVSSGLLSKLNQDELEGVLGHEIAHIANGDMVTMTLVQGVVNAFVMFFSRIAAFAVSSAMNSDDDDGPRSGGFLQFGLVIFFDIIFGLLAMPVVAWFSRFREYRADAGGSALAGKEKMIAALEKLKSTYEITEQLPAAESGMQSMQISSKSKFFKWFSTHPPLDARIDALRNR